MTSQSNPVLTSLLKSFSRASSLIVIIIGCLVLIGWALNIAVLKSVFPGLVTMKANTALGFVLAGVSLWLLQPEQTDQRIRRIAQACALTVTCLGLLTLSQYLFGWDLGIDQLLFQDLQTDPATSKPGRMAPATALNFLMLGAALLLVDVETRRGHCPAQWLILVAALISLIAIVGYAYGVQALYRIGAYSSVAFHTAVALLALSIGSLCARPSRGLMVIISSSSMGGLTARRLLPAAISIPLILGWLRLEGERAGLYDTEFGLSLLVVASIVLFTVVVWWNARALAETDTLRRRKEEELRKSEQKALAAEEKFRGILESAPDPIVISDQTGNIVLLNGQTEKVFGYRREELVGKPVEILLPEKLRGDHVGHREKYYGELRTRPMGMGSWYDLYGQRKDGTAVPVDIALSPVRTDGQLLVMSIIRDITDRKRAEKELQARYQELQALHEIGQTVLNSVDLKPIVEGLLDKALSIRSFDIGVIRLLDPSNRMLKPAISRGYHDPHNIREISTDVRDATAGAIQLKVLTGEGVIVVENLPSSPGMRSFKKEGVQSAIVVPIRAGENMLGTIQLGSRTPRKFQPKEIRLLEVIGNQMGIAVQKTRLYEDIKKRTDELEKSNRVKDEFLSVMSHELRTPLNVVMGYTGMIKDGLLGEITPQQEEALGKVISRANDQLVIVNNILYATVLETEKVNIDMHEVSVGDFLSNLKAAYEAPINKDLTLEWDYPADLPVVKTDSAKLKLIMQNLIDNALKFTSKGNVTISARIRQQEEERQQAIGSRQQEEKPLTPHGSPLTPRYVEIKVADTGVGIPKDAMPFIFDKFYQVDSSETRLFGGVGMGLYLVKNFAKLLRGKVDVESEPGKGSTFTVKIPCDTLSQV